MNKLNFVYFTLIHDDYKMVADGYIHFVCIYYDVTVIYLARSENVCTPLQVIALWKFSMALNE